MGWVASRQPASSTSWPAARPSPPGASSSRSGALGPRLRCSSSSPWAGQPWPAYSSVRARRAAGLVMAATLAESALQVEGVSSQRPVDWRGRCGGKIGWREGTKLSERSGTLADDPFSRRHPTAHERLTGLPWDASYHDGPAPWAVGHPQPAIVRLASEGGFAGAVLDAGCRTAENALHVASLGLSVLGVDVAETALATARAKADDRGIEVEFASADAFELGRLVRRFEPVLDCGLFHTLVGDERPGYVASLARVTKHDGTLYVLCFS